MTLDRYKDEPPILAPVDGSPITHAVFCDQDLPFQVCTNCIMDSTDPEICFDEMGVCNHCNYFKNNIIPAWDLKSGSADNLDNTISKIKDYGRGKPYDCILGLSGGVDSSYLAVKAAQWGLRPLVVHVDAGWNSELAVMNIQQICQRLGFDLITHVIDWPTMRDLQLAFMKSNLANQDVPQDHAFFAALYNYANKEKIKYVLSGSNFATESILPQAWGYDAMDATHLKSVHKKFGRKNLKRFPILGFYDFYFKYPYVKKMEIIKPLNMIDYSKELAIQELESNYGWRYYGGKHYESRWTRFFQGYYLPHKFGYDKRKAHLASLVVTGEISRENALQQLSKPLYDPVLLREDKEFVSKKLGITIDELEKLIKEPCSHYTKFANHQKKLKRAFAYYGKLTMFQAQLKVKFKFLSRITGH